MVLRLDRTKYVAIISGSVVALVGVFSVYVFMNTEFDLIMPDNARLANVTLSPDNFSKLKQNVGIFTVYQPHITTKNTTSGYCRVAEFIHENEDGYNNTVVGNTTIYNATSPPDWCAAELNPLPVPEFSTEIMALLACFGFFVSLCYLLNLVSQTRDLILFRGGRTE